MMDNPMMLVTINEGGIIFSSEVGGDVDDEMDVVSGAVVLIEAMRERGFPVCQMLVCDTTLRVAVT